RARATQQLADESLAARPEQERKPAERTLELGEAVEELEVLGRALPEADARVDNHPVTWHAERLRGIDRHAQPVDDVVEDAVRIVDLLLVVHEDEVRTALRCDHRR